MPDLHYYVWHHGGSWHWEVRTDLDDQIGHGATFTKAAATAEAMIYATHPARSSKSTPSNSDDLPSEPKPRIVLPPTPSGDGR